jgi:S-DNA-T family DNA segregation ATPase FtsK/SpoIIIE
MNAAAKTSTFRMLAAIASLVTAGLLGVLVTSLTTVLQTWTARRSTARAQAYAPARVSQPVAPPATRMPQPAFQAGAWSVPAPQAFYAPPPAAVYAPAAPPARSQTVVPMPPPRAPRPVTVPAAAPRAFELPAADCLAGSNAPAAEVDQDKLEANAATITETLAHYGVQGKVEDILPGPTVTTYEFAPAAGTKVSKVAALVDDIALALGRKVRIIAPIPGKNRIGVELPNEKVSPVVLRDLIEDPRFRSFEGALPVVLGKDTTGEPVYADLAAMPHVIVGGATGSGKSVGLNVMLLSMLYRRSPSELKLLMIDPKVVELAPYNRIPHMLLPVVTDMKEASKALNWAVSEMERRYQLFADAGTKNVASYNAWVERVARGQEPNPNAKVVDLAGAPPAPLPEKLPSIVIVVDEFADLITQQGKDKEVETAVARLAQKARAAGMHCILATQRPSVDVITGTIKANFPSRIAFRVSQRVDSGTILDGPGAEHLLGKGDMLVKLNGSSDAQRVQCPFVADEEVNRVTGYLRSQGAPVSSILRAQQDDQQDDQQADQQAEPPRARRVA